MKTRQEIKALAKESVAMQRDKAILIPFLVGLIMLAASVLGTLAANRVPVAGSLINIALSGITMVLAVNISKSFYKIYNREAVELSEPLKDLGVNFFRKLGGSWWMSLWVFLWSLITLIPGIIFISVVLGNALIGGLSTGLYSGGMVYFGDPYLDGVFNILTSYFWVFLLIPLFFIPGIIKMYSYMFTLNILAVHPEVKATQALKLSMRITKGHRWELFVMHLSFLGWTLLSGLTFGILAIVYVGPYMSATDAGFFTEMRDEAIAAGRVDASELGMAMQPPPPGIPPEIK